jgi:4-diphosphocytidyl-2-C-methyl-D-erythritol kinase
MAAGLGGGSSDGAAVVRSIIAILNLQSQDQDVIHLCRALGSDVPFFYRQETARVQEPRDIDTATSQKSYQVMIVKPKKDYPRKRSSPNMMKPQ